MRQFRKGRRLVALCEQKALNVQRIIARLNGERKKLIERIQQYEIELLSLAQALVSLQINDASVTRAVIYMQRKQQAILLHQRAQVVLERTIDMENLSDLELEIQFNQKLLAVLRRKEMKFTRWMQQGKRQWMMEQESQSEDEKQDMFPFVG